MIEKQSFGRYAQYLLRSGNLEAAVTELGVTVTRLRYKGRELALKLDTPEDYARHPGYICPVVGRYANRIGGARFTLEGREIRLPANEGRNFIHGGPQGFSRRRWDSQVVEGGVRFTLFSPDGDNGFPGDLLAAVTCRTEGETLRLDFEAESGEDTVYSPTTHLYLALGGGCLDYSLRIDADRYVEVDEELIPTGRLLSVEGDFDFRSPRRIRRDYDHCFVLRSSDACAVSANGVAVDLRTDFPGLQIYTASGIKEPFKPNCALAVEPQYLPDSPNHPNFPSTLLKKGEKFHRWAEFRFRED